MSMASDQIIEAVTILRTVWPNTSFNFGRPVRYAMTVGMSSAETRDSNSQYGPIRSALGMTEWSAPTASTANTAGQCGSRPVGSASACNSVLLEDMSGIMMNVARHLPMKVVVQSSSLLFTVLSILLNVPITRVKRKPQRTEEQLEAPKAAGG